MVTNVTIGLDALWYAIGSPDTFDCVDDWSCCVWAVWFCCWLDEASEYDEMDKVVLFGQFAGLPVQPENRTAARSIAIMIKMGSEVTPIFIGLPLTGTVSS